jgi:hypothetical protein
LRCHLIKSARVSANCQANSGSSSLAVIHLSHFWRAHTCFIAIGHGEFRLAVAIDSQPVRCLAARATTVLRRSTASHTVAVKFATALNTFAQLMDVLPSCEVAICRAV